MSEDNKSNRKDELKKMAFTAFLEKFPPGIIPLTILEGFRDLFSKEPPFTSMELSKSQSPEKGKTE